MSDAPTTGSRPDRLPSPLTPEGFAAATGVSRETLAALRRYAELLIKWQAKINLVSGDSLADLWSRHMLDSAQLYPLLPPSARVLADLGSGAGFPGLVLAILGVPEVHLIESDARKCAFLIEAARLAGLAPGQNPIIHRSRVEAVPGFAADVVTARACAPLDRLLGYGERFLGPRSVCVFPKGVQVEDELTAAKNWRMTVERIPSITDSSGTILRIGHITRAGR
jgi:16S rRNA (guanine527-N7)-methyltransferase